ncbi:MAG: hypothetical protein EOM24_22820, partial [Chloroflexia bacterium]|nr:hypothetical protein [Chloroflexia bacterium]
IKVGELELARTGLSEHEAKTLGLDVKTVMVQASSLPHYYPGGAPIWFKLNYENGTKRILGAQGAGKQGVVLRIDIFASAIANGMSADELGMLDLCYAPPFSTTWDAVHIAANAAKEMDHQRTIPDLPGITSRVRRNAIPGKQDRGGLTLDRVLLPLFGLQILHALRRTIGVALGFKAQHRTRGQSTHDKLAFGVLGTIDIPALRIEGRVLDARSGAIGYTEAIGHNLGHPHQFFRASKRTGRRRIVPHTIRITITGRPKKLDQRIETTGDLNWFGRHKDDWRAAIGGLAFEDYIAFQAHTDIIKRMRPSE